MGDFDFGRRGPFSDVDAPDYSTVGVYDDEVRVLDRAPSTCAHVTSLTCPPVTRCDIKCAIHSTRERVVT
jgi:hypothetical protein